VPPRLWRANPLLRHFSLSAHQDVGRKRASRRSTPDAEIIAHGRALDRARSGSRCKRRCQRQQCQCRCQPGGCLQPFGLHRVSTEEAKGEFSGFAQDDCIMHSVSTPG